jgi:hypothetical protein
MVRPAMPYTCMVLLLERARAWLPVSGCLVVWLRRCRDRLPPALRLFRAWAVAHAHGWLRRLAVLRPGSYHRLTIHMHICVPCACRCDVSRCLRVGVRLCVLAVGVVELWRVASTARCATRRHRRHTCRRGAVSTQSALAACSGSACRLRRHGGSGSGAVDSSLWRCRRGRCVVPAALQRLHLWQFYHRVVVCRVRWCHRAAASMGGLAGCGRLWWSDVLAARVWG